MNSQGQNYIQEKVTHNIKQQEFLIYLSIYITAGIYDLSYKIIHQKMEDSPTKFKLKRCLHTKFIHCKFHFIHSEFHHEQGCPFVIINSTRYIRFLSLIEDAAISIQKPNTYNDHDKQLYSCCQIRITMIPHQKN